jgi:tRNA(fMet)-specific endonuclease VapC
MFLTALVASWTGFTLAPFTIPAAARFGALDRAKLNVKKNDLRIAAIALELGATVVTRNRRDFGRIPGLVIEDRSV